MTKTARRYFRMAGVVLAGLVGIEVIEQPALPVDNEHAPHADHSPVIRVAQYVEMDTTTKPKVTILRAM
jgi:hypothetical protein